MMDFFFKGIKHVELHFIFCQVTYKIFSAVEIPPLLGAIASVLIVHPTLGNSAVDLLGIAGNMDPKLGVPLFLVVLFYNNILSRKSQEIDFQDILVSLQAL